MKAAVKTRNRPPEMPVTTAAWRVIIEAGLKFAAEMLLVRRQGIALPTREETIGLSLLERDGEVKR